MAIDKLVRNFNALMAFVDRWRTNTKAIFACLAHLMQMPEASQ
jgi:hypothetical protein